MNLILWGVRSSAAIPFTTLLAVLALWFGVSAPLTFIGAFFGYKKKVILHYHQLVSNGVIMKVKNQANRCGLGSKCKTSNLLILNVFQSIQMGCGLLMLYK